MRTQPFKYYKSHIGTIQACQKTIIKIVVRVFIKIILKDRWIFLTKSVYNYSMNTLHFATQYLQLEMGGNWI